MADTIHRFWNNYALLGVSLVNGAVIMVFELIGSRIIAPHLGSSSFVWTSIIGVILMALSGGYYAGGMLADKGASRVRLAQILLVAAALIVISRLIRDDFLTVVRGAAVDVRVKSFFASIVLFGPASFVMGIVSPYVARLQLQDIKHAGKTIGSVYAAGTAGSIIGTFLYGYWLVSVFPSGTVHAALAVVMVLLSVAVSAGRILGKQTAASAAIVALAFISMFAVLKSSATELDTDTQYARVIVNKTELNGRPVRLYLTEANRAQSGIYLDGDRSSAFAYVQRITDYVSTVPHGKVLMIGGGTFTLATDLARIDPSVSIDVVEIDPGLTGIARRYFYFQDSPQITVYNQDGREFLNTASGAYDVIIIDAFTVNGPPFYLATQEAVAAMRDRLKPDGVVITNLISSFQGENARLLDAVHATYLTSFENLAITPASHGLPPRTTLQNILLFASSNPERMPENGAAHTPDASIAPLTDDFAPVEYYTSRALNSR